MPNDWPWWRSARSHGPAAGEDPSRSRTTRRRGIVIGRDPALCLPIRRSWTDRRATATTTPRFSTQLASREHAPRSASVVSSADCPTVEAQARVRVAWSMPSDPCGMDCPQAERRRPSHDVVGPISTTRPQAPRHQPPPDARRHVLPGRRATEAGGTGCQVGAHLCWLCQAPPVAGPSRQPGSSGGHHVRRGVPRDPGASIGKPIRHSGQLADPGSTIGRFNVQRASTGYERPLSGDAIWDIPPDRSTSTDASTSRPPIASIAGNIGSRELPVVRMSSTKRTVSPGVILNPRRNSR